ncbi:MAG: tRNA 2-thiouridine(34) synthase MnmA, partial [Oleispira sp.]|nr:tRNA 2-thiouridine(34) synthase MnmA [Oleispira sp.]
GLGIGGLNGYSDDPWYVVAKDLERNVLVAAQGKNHPLLFSHSLTSHQIFWVNDEPVLPLTCTAKVRYRQTDQACIINKDEQGCYRVLFTEPQRAVTPGQSVVFYLNELCLGGGVIEQTQVDPERATELN